MARDGENLLISKVRSLKFPLSLFSQFSRCPRNGSECLPRNNVISINVLTISLFSAICFRLCSYICGRTGIADNFNLTTIEAFICASVFSCEPMSFILYHA